MCLFILGGGGGRVEGEGLKHTQFWGQSPVWLNRWTTQAPQCYLFVVYSSKDFLCIYRPVIIQIHIHFWSCFYPNGKVGKWDLTIPLVTELINAVMLCLSPSKDCTASLHVVKQLNFTSCVKWEPFRQYRQNWHVLLQLRFGRKSGIF